jgi:hypothetical protein
MRQGPPEGATPRALAARACALLVDLVTFG